MHIFEYNRRIKINIFIFITILFFCIIPYIKTFQLYTSIYEFGAKTYKMQFLACTFFVSFLAIKKSHKESTKEKKEKTCNCFLCPPVCDCTGIFLFGFAESLTRPIAAFGSTVEVQYRSYFNRNRVDGVNNRLRNSASLLATFI